MLSVVEPEMSSQLRDNHMTTTNSDHGGHESCSSNSSAAVTVNFIGIIEATSTGIIRTRRAPETHTQPHVPDSFKSTTACN